MRWEGMKDGLEMEDGKGAGVENVVSECTCFDSAGVRVRCVTRFKVG